MNLIGRRTPRVTALVLVLTLGLMMGCNARATAVPTDVASTYGGALNTSYPDALDVISQLALGTLKLEGTPDAVTEAQATQLLPLWEALNGTAVQVESERLAVARQIEGTMTETQVSAIAALALTQADEQAWTQDQGFGLPGGLGAGGPITGTTPGGAATGNGGATGAQAGGRAGGFTPGGSGAATGGDQSTARQRFQNMTPEERATLAAQFGGQGRTGTTGSGTVASASNGVVRAVVMLLTVRSGQTPAGAPFGRAGQSGGAPAGDGTGPAGTGPTQEGSGPTSQPTSSPEPTVEPTATPQVMPTATAEAPAQAENTVPEATATPVATATPAVAAGAPVVAAGTSALLPAHRQLLPASPPSLIPRWPSPRSRRPRLLPWRPLLRQPSHRFRIRIPVRLSRWRSV